MNKKILFAFIFCLSGCLMAYNGYGYSISENPAKVKLNDTVPPPDVMEVLTTVILATDGFKAELVTNLYTPNAVVSDDGPPYSWNGPTAGVQWVASVEEACRANHVTKLKASIQPVNVYQLLGDNIYIVVPVNYTGNLPHKAAFTATGAFTFVLRQTNGKWLIKSQAWMPRKAIE